jgi:hypothetical protein
MIRILHKAIVTICEIGRRDEVERADLGGFVIGAPKERCHRSGRKLRVVLVVEDWSPKFGWGSDDDLGVACYTQII